MLKRYLKWRTQNLKEGEGVIVGSDLSQEWLLPWWWENFTKTNSYPVAFIDFGLSEEKKRWCAQRGELVPLPLFDFLVKDKEEVSSARVASWESRYGENFWQYRKAWFKKPLACLQSPYLRTLWLDLDCEVRGSLKDLFLACDHPSGIAMAKDKDAPSSSFPIYNSGVIAFRRNLPLLQKWAAKSFETNQFFRGDQDLLSQMIKTLNVSVCELPSIYNWNISDGRDPSAVIYHWIGDYQKHRLRDQIILAELYQPQIFRS